MFPKTLKIFLPDLVGTRKDTNIPILMNNKFLPNLVLFIVAFALTNLPGIGFLESAHAVVPAPDGGYPNFNTAEGTNSLQHVTPGIGNTAAGWASVFSTY